MDETDLELMRAEKARRARLGVLREVMTDPLFVDLRETAAPEEMDPAEARARCAEIEGQIGRIDALLEMAEEERAALGRTRSASEADAEGTAPDEGPGQGG